MEGLTCEDCRGTGVRSDDRDICRACMGSGSADPYPLTLGEAVAELICREIDEVPIGPKLYQQILLALPKELGITQETPVFQVLHEVMLWLALKDGKEPDVEDIPE